MIDDKKELGEFISEGLKDWLFSKWKYRSDLKLMGRVADNISSFVNIIDHLQENYPLRVKRIKYNLKLSIKYMQEISSMMKRGLSERDIFQDN